MTDITEHPQEGDVYCCGPRYLSRLIVGWSLDRRPTATMVKSALGMASRHLEAVLREYLVHYRDVDGAT